jgi:hypothetical protein
MKKRMLISIIILQHEKEQQPSVLDSLKFESDNYEIVVVTDSPALTDATFLHNPAPVKIVGVRSGRLADWLNAGVQAAQGEIFFFLESHHYLPGDALAAIRRNFELLPQTLGGNFHLDIETDSLFAQLTRRLVKWKRYGGSYGVDSGLFVRKTVFTALRGFRPEARFTDYDFARRLEKLGPTLFLPNTLVLPTPNIKQVLALLLA